ncbi:MAG: hypothetical protein QM765_33310 [Myxococcales bacterium]
MRRTRRALERLGLRGLLAVVGGAASIVGTACGIAPLYGAQPPYGVPSDCVDDSYCKQAFGAGWYCDRSQGQCAATPADAGTDADAGK